MRGKPASKLMSAEVERFARGVADAYEEALSGHAETTWGSMTLSQQTAIQEQMHTSLGSRLLEFFESVGWQGRGYASVRNRYLLDAKGTMLPDDLSDPRGYGEVRKELAELDRSDRMRVLDLYHR